MKPHRLEFSGLNSYRDRQFIDFTELGLDGLFGIFGPTGSGKSSILDAITLALYGSVDRAAMRTRGIINLAEDYAETSYTFALGVDEYRVERRFSRDRGDRNSARCDYARLIHAPGTGAEDVMASGAKETTDGVSGLLGLSAAEFSRAVVLPQGKFDRFLRLTGGDRARMLERIFRLEQFGDGLASKARSYTAAREAEIETIDRLVAELGDCSDETLRDLKEQYRSAHEEYEGVRDLIGDLESAYAEKQEAFRLSKELEDSREALRKLELCREEIDATRRRLEECQKAEGIRSIFGYVESLRRSGEQIATEVSEVSTEFEKAEAHFTKARERWHRLLGSASDPADLRNLVKQLEGAVESFESIRKLESDLAKLRKHRRCHEREKSRIEEGLEELRRKLTRILEERDDKRKYLRSIEVSPDEKGELSDLREWLGAYRAEVESITAKEKRLRESGCECRRALGELRRIFGASRGTRRLSPRAMNEAAEERLRDLEKEIARAEGESDRATMADASLRMARELEPGQPCPVCGSLEHPEPASGDSPRVDAIFDELRDLRDERSKVADWARDVRDAFGDYRRLVGETLDLRKEFKENRMRQAIVLRDARRQHGIDWYRRAHELESDIAARESEIPGIRALLEELEEELEEIRSEISEVEADLRERAGRGHEMDLKIRSYVAEIEEPSARVRRLVGDGDPSEALSSQRAELKRVESERESAERDLEMARSARDDLRVKLESLRGKVEENADTLEDFEIELERALEEAGIESEEHLRESLPEEGELERLKASLEAYASERAAAESDVRRLEEQLGDRSASSDDVEEVGSRLRSARSSFESLASQKGLAADALVRMARSRRRFGELERERSKLLGERNAGSTLAALLSGRKLVTFLASEHLMDMTEEASDRLSDLTGGRFGLVINEDSSEFFVRDDHNGAQLRPVGSLSGGETFLASLALALALSSKIQLRGKHPLGLFFLDEGFGTLDESRLEVVMTSLERLRDRERIVGLISHVPEIKHRLPRYLEIVPPDGAGAGSRVVGVGAASRRNTS